jgi:hypothetical protein
MKKSRVIGFIVKNILIEMDLVCESMKSFERILIKIILVQFVFLILSQLFFHKLHIFPELKQITQYEGVSNNNFSEILETFNGAK